MWRRIGPAALAGPDAVARPLALLDRLRPDDTPVASWSTTAAPVVVAGRGMRPAEINAAACAASGVAILHRRSGGGPVLWDTGLISLDVVLPPGHPLADRDVTRAYAWLGGAVATALAGLGVPAAAIPLTDARSAQARTDPTSRLAARACFGGISPFEVVTPDLRKLVGLAQLRRTQGTVFQCGIALEFDADRLAALLSYDPADQRALAQALRARVAAVHEYGPSLTAAAVIGAVEAVLAAAHGVGFRADVPRADERALEAELARTLVVAGPPRTV